MIRVSVAQNALFLNKIAQQTGRFLAPVRCANHFKIKYLSATLFYFSGVFKEADGLPYLAHHVRARRGGGI